MDVNEEDTRLGVFELRVKSKLIFDPFKEFIYSTGCIASKVRVIFLWIYLGRRGCSLSASIQDLRVCLKEPIWTD